MIITPFNVSMSALLTVNFLFLIHFLIKLSRLFEIKKFMFFLGTQVFCLFIVHLFIYLLFDFVFVLIIENNILKIFFQNHFFDLKV